MSASEYKKPQKKRSIPLFGRSRKASGEYSSVFGEPTSTTTITVDEDGNTETISMKIQKASQEMEPLYKKVMVEVESVREFKDSSYRDESQEEFREAFNYLTELYAKTTSEYDGESTCKSFEILWGSKIESIKSEIKGLIPNFEEDGN